MKKLFLLLAITACFIACDGNLPKSMSEVKRSGKYIWSFLGMKTSEVDADLIKAGWVQNYSGKTYSGSPVRLYIYNRPGDLNWGPCNFKKYATPNQKTDRGALCQLLESGKVYGELYMIIGDDEVVDIGVYWLLPTTGNNGLEAYANFSKGTYKAYKSECGNNASWEGKIDGNVYTDHQSFMDDLQRCTQPKIKEDASYKSSAMKCAYSMESAYNYQVNNTFEFNFWAEKYEK